MSEKEETDMFEIKWVETPKCSECHYNEPIKGRYCCLGCYKKKEKTQKNSKKRWHSHLSEKENELRKEEILALKNEGKSYAFIGVKLNLSRSTVQSIVRAFNNKSIKINHELSA